MSFEPVYGPASRVLILGSWPSPESWRQGFYYGHPRNRFWPLLARLCGAETPQTVGQKRALILQNGLALWDVLESCTVTGASDASIKDPVPVDLAALLKAAPGGAVQRGHRLAALRGAAAAGVRHRRCAAAQHQPRQRRLEHGQAGRGLGRSAGALAGRLIYSLYNGKIVTNGGQACPHRRSEP